MRRIAYIAVTIVIMLVISSVYEPSRIWLDEHGLKNVRLYCLNK